MWRYCEMDRRGNKWSWINHNGRKLQRILTRGEAKHTELYSDPLQAYKRRTFNSAAFLAKETFISVSVLLRKERMVHDCDELLEDSPYSDSLLSCHPMLYKLRKQLMFTHWWAVLKCCRTFFLNPAHAQTHWWAVIQCCRTSDVYASALCLQCANVFPLQQRAPFKWLLGTVFPPWPFIFNYTLPWERVAL